MGHTSLEFLAISLLYINIYTEHILLAQLCLRRLFPESSHSCSVYNNYNFDLVNFFNLKFYLYWFLKQLKENKEYYCESALYIFLR